MRLDKFLKVSRLIKRRTVANEACDAGRVMVNGKEAKASVKVKVGDIIEIAFGNKPVKVEVLAARLREINPDVKLTVRAEAYGEANAADFGLERYDYVIDAIDSLSCKAALIRHALSLPSVTLFASMGAALKMDPFQIRATEFRKIEGDGLARALRQRFKKTGGLPSRTFTCVWSPEHRENLGDVVQPDAEDSWAAMKARLNGTVAHTTAIFGFALAGLVVQDVERRMRNG